MGLFDLVKKKKEQLDKMDETFYLPEDVNKDDPIWKLRTINDIVVAMCGRMTRKSDYGENMGALSQEERIFYVTTEIESQVNSMGFEHFFYDEAGRLAMESPEALRTIGSNQKAEVAEKALAVVGGALPEDDKERARFIRYDLTDEMRKALSELDEEYRAIDDDFNRLTFIYIREYHQKFTEE